MPPKKIEKVESLDAPNLQVLLAKAASKNLELEKNIKQLNIDYEEKLNEKDKIIKGLKKELDVAKKSKLISVGDEDLESKQRIVLMLRARGYTIDGILSYANSNALDGINNELIEYTINNMPMLSPSLEAYYNSEKKIFEEKIKVSGDYVKQTIIDILIQNLDAINLAISECDKKDVQTLRQLIETKTNLSKEFNKLLGNLNEEEEINNNAKIDKINETMSNYKPTNKIFIMPKKIKEISNE